MFAFACRFFLFYFHAYCALNLDLQASLGIREDGIMTTELFELLYVSQQTKSSSSSTSPVKDDVIKVSFMYQSSE